MGGTTPMVKLENLLSFSYGLSVSIFDGYRYTETVKEDVFKMRNNFPLYMKITISKEMCSQIYFRSRDR